MGMMRPILLCAVAGIVALPGAGAAQSLAEAARQAAEQREALGASTEVFTNESLRPESPPAVPVRTPVEPATAGTPVAQDAEGITAEGDAAGDEPAAGAPTDDEDYWRGQLGAAREALARAKTLEAALQTRVSSLTADFTARDDPAQRQILFDERQTALAEIARMQETIAAAQETIDDIREEGRRAGVPAGWLR